MATTVRTRTATFKSKSDHVRALLAEGKTIAEITRLVPNMGYAFAYGIAKRAGLAETAANRRQTRQVVTVGDSIHVRIVAEGEYTGTVIVNTITGKVTRTK